MDFDRAEIIAINGLSFIAGDEKHLSGYLNLSGSDLNIIRDNLTHPELAAEIYASILDYLLQNEKCLIEYSQSYEMDPMDVARARRMLPGTLPEV